jgi:hypothetical protein
LLLFTLVAAPALAQDTPIESGVSVQLHVGERKTLDVGLAIGLNCDDGTIVRAELVADSPTANHLVLTGLKPGTTSCRAGTANMSRSKLVNITVTAKNRAH